MFFMGYFLYVYNQDLFWKVSKNSKENNFLSISNENGCTNICVNLSEIRVVLPSEFLFLEYKGEKE